MGFGKACQFILFSGKKCCHLEEEDPDGCCGGRGHTRTSDQTFAKCQGEVDPFSGQC